MDDRQLDHLHSIHACAVDILRFVMLIGFGGKISRDRKRDIISRAQRILSLAEKL